MCRVRHRAGDSLKLVVLVLEYGESVHSTVGDLCRILAPVVAVYLSINPGLARVEVQVLTTV